MQQVLGRTGLGGTQSGPEHLLLVAEEDLLAQEQGRLGGPPDQV